MDVPAGKSVLVPLAGTDAAGNPITYTASSSDPNITVSVVSPASKSIVLNVTGTDKKSGNAFSGQLVLHLFEDFAPETTARIEQLVSQGYYNGLNISSACSMASWPKPANRITARYGRAA